MHLATTPPQDKIKPKSRRLTSMIVMVTVIALAVAGFAAWRTTVQNASRQAALAGVLLGGRNLDGSSGLNLGPPSTLSVTHTITVSGYQETGREADADITYETPSGTQQDSVDDGWSRTFTFSPGDFVYISAQNMTQGSISCSIEVDGSVISSNSSNGEFKIATCDGTAG